MIFHYICANFMPVEKVFHSIKLEKLRTMNIKSFVASLLTAAVTLVGFGKTGPEIQFLDTYDQLTKVIGQEGHWFVRDASNTRTGQHGDPTVNKGWAIYTWDVKINGWRKICEEESLDNSVSEALLRQYVKVTTFNQAMQTVANTYTTLKTHNDDKRLLDLAIGNNKENISKLENRLNIEIGPAVESATRTASDAQDDVRYLRAMIETFDIETVSILLSQMTNRVVQTEIKVDELDRTVATVTNLVYGKGVDTNAVRDIARELDDEVKTDVKGYTDDALKRFRVDEIIFGEGASNANTQAKGQIVLGPSKNYPSVVFDSYNILLGIDSLVGYGFTEGKSTRYAAAIGTSNKAKYMHSYAFGSQLNSLAANSTTIGYGLTADDEESTVIGHGNRSIHDKYFDTIDQLNEFFSDPECTNTIFVGYGVLVGNGPGCSHIVDEVLTEPNEDGLYATLRLDPLDIEVGSRRWDYGKSHGKGTFNIVARGDGIHIFDPDTGSHDPGPSAVYVNDRSLLDWLGIHLGEQTIKPIYNKGIFGPETSTCVNDYTISIGQNARALEAETSCQAIAIGRDALSAGSATVAVGPNAFAYGSLATALGWRANAVGQHAIAIGSAKKSGENYFVDGAVNPNSDLCVAVGDDAIAIGFNTKAYNNKSVALGYYATAKADSAVQIGMGTNTIPRSVKFYDTTVFKDGRLVGVGAFNPEDLDPKKVPIETITADEVVVTCMPHRVNTLTSVTNLGVGTECYLEPTGSRNYDVFIPNKSEFRAGMPITIDIEIDNCSAIFMDDKNQIFHLPAMVHVQQPDDDIILFTIKELRDKKYDWKPVVTKINIKFDLVAGKFFTEGGKKSLEGYNLHAATAYKITYPTSASETTTADLVKVETTGICPGTFFDYADAVDFTPPADKKIFFDGTKSWFEITYTTHDGTAVIERQEISN